MTKLRPIGHPILDKLTWRIKEPSQLLPRLPYPKKPILERGTTYKKDGTSTPYEEYRAPLDFYDWLDGRVHRLDRDKLWQNAIYRLASPLTCFLQDTSLGVYDDIDDDRWETNRVF